MQSVHVHVFFLLFPITKLVFPSWQLRLIRNVAEWLTNNGGFHIYLWELYYTIM